MHRTITVGALLLVGFVSFSFALPPTAKPLPPREAAAAMTLPEGFKATLFAGEPDVSQPIAMCFDDRGRLWVAECHSYPKWIKDEPGKPFIGEDKILIFEDTNNDGVFDKRTVFLDKLANLTSIEFGFGGLYALTPPYLVHIPIGKNSDEPSGPPVKLLDGWNLDIRHNIVNGLKWGPDGWLYGCHGILATSYAGAPGTPKEKRPPINCGVWRYHPVSQKYEVVCHGGTNPWGIDWDESADLYFTNCVIDHAFRVVSGGHYQRMYGNDFHPNLYKLMGSCCDHIHWAGGAWTSSRGGDGKHSEAGGGHAHSGCMIYLGDRFPKEFRNCLFTGNIHGNRLNCDRIDDTKHGPVLRHEKDFLLANDPWFRPLAMNYGPDGGVFVLDWTDTGECHNYDVAHKTSGRIFKITPGFKAFKKRDLASMSDKDLIALHGSANEWDVRHARRILMERSRSDYNLRTQMMNQVAETVKDFTQKIPNLSDEDLEKLAPAIEQLKRQSTRTIFAIRDPALVPKELPDPAKASPESIGWSLQIVFEFGDLDRVSWLAKPMLELAATTEHRSLREKMASGLQRLPAAQRWELARALAQRGEDRDDEQLALLLWYAVEPLPEADAAKSIDLIHVAKIPLVREFLARRIASLPGEDGIERLVELAGKSADKAVPDGVERARDILAGLQSAFEGRRSAAAPKAWNEAYPRLQNHPLTRDRGMTLAVLFGDVRALKDLRAIVADAKADAARRRSALKTLAFAQAGDVRALLADLLQDDVLRGDAIRTLATFSDDKVAPQLLELYPKLSAAERQAAVGTLTSRPAFALSLLDAVAARKVERADLDPASVRQMLALKDAKVAARVEEVWGTLRPASKDKTALMTKYKKLLTQDEIKTADQSLGKAMFAKHCSACHKLFGEGGMVGPDLTGSQRANLDYILENVLDPSAIVPREWQVTVFQTTAGRTLSGLVKEENERAVTVQTATEIVLLPKTEIESRTATKQSMMPDGVFEQLSPAEARALVAYLARETPLK